MVMCEFAVGDRMKKGIVSLLRVYDDVGNEVIVVVYETGKIEVVRERAWGVVKRKVLFSCDVTVG